MASTYSSSIATPKDRARLLLGDNGADGGVFLLTDEEIAAFLATLHFNEAVAQLADSLAVRFAQYPDETETPGGHTIKWTERVTAWQELAKRMRSASGPSTRRRPAYLGALTNPTENNLR